MFVYWSSASTIREESFWEKLRSLSHPITCATYKLVLALFGKFNMKSVLKEKHDSISNVLAASKFQGPGLVAS